MHPNTRESIEITVKRYKPESEKYLYGVIMTEKTVVAIIKHNPKIIVFPAGKLLFISCLLFQEISTSYSIIW